MKCQHNDNESDDLLMCGASPSSGTDDERTKQNTENAHIRQETCFDNKGMSIDDAIQNAQRSVDMLCETTNMTLIAVTLGYAMTIFVGALILMRLSDICV